MYRIAERRLLADVSMPELQAFAISGSEHDSRPAAATESGERQLLFRGQADLGGHRRRIECAWRGGGYRLEVTGLGRFGVSPAGQQITFDAESEVTGGEGLTETILGPMLILSLALQDVWCLHASAVQRGREALLFLGASGAGKSTLARELPRLHRDFRCAADDVSPIVLESSNAKILSRFPQLKYQSDRQPGASVPAILRLAAIHVLDPRPDVEVAIEPMTGMAATMALVQHTHSARLFTKELLRRHTEQCARLAEVVPIRRLTYPHSWQLLPRVAEALR